MDEDRGKLIHCLRVILPQPLEVLLQLANGITLALELRHDERLLALQPSDEVRRCFRYPNRILLREEVSCCSKSRGERSVLRWR